MIDKEFIPMEVWIFMAVGLYAITGALFDWNWFMLSRRGKWFVRIFGRDGARIFYFLMGIAFIGIGGLSLAGIISFE